MLLNESDLTSHIRTALCQSHQVKDKDHPCCQSCNLYLGRSSTNSNEFELSSCRLPLTFKFLGCGGWREGASLGERIGGARVTPSYFSSAFHISAELSGNTLKED